MVSFDRNIANDQSFPLEPRSRSYRSIKVTTAHELPPSTEWLQQISTAWDKLLVSIGDVQASLPAFTRVSRNFVCTQPELPNLIVRILNRFQLLMWIYESQGKHPDLSGKTVERLIRIKEAIQRDLTQLRKLVRESSFQSRLCLRTVEISDQLAEFFDRLSLKNG